MKAILFAILTLLMFSGCSKKEKADNQQQVADTTISFESKPIVSNYQNISTEPISSDILKKIFPESFGDLRLDKVNTGKIKYSSLTVNTASGEYVSSLGLVVIYIYDYLSFSNLPEHLKNLYELKPGKDVYFIKNGAGVFSSDELSNGSKLDLVYYGRFHIKIEAINYPNFRETAMDLVQNLNFSVLEKLIKVKV
ncbi:hypothetical protein D9V87_07190 [Bacteroidetes/Chlorobi group bacterium MS-B_bin-24]|nr:MAG: hypothetical protein D9V87_07190 [Bacteroidetes/Chlorobi group bacterium MS-B_bin-24]